MSASPYSAIMFDLDGTLLDTLQDLADAMNAALRQHGYPVHPVAPYRHFVGDGVRNLVSRALPPEARSDAVIEACAKAMRAAYAQHWDRTSHPYPGVPELLAVLHERGLPCLVLSNKPHEFTVLAVEKLLAGCRFDGVQGAVEGVPLKPDPAAALHLAERFQLDPAAILYLGDTNTDMQTARNAGMLAVGVTWGFRSAEELTASGAQHLLDHPRDLLALLG